MNSRTTPPDLKRDARVNGPAIPELERQPFPRVADVDRSGVVVSSPRPKRRVVKRRVSPLKALVFLFAAAVAIVLYIGNVIAVGNLLADIDVQQKQYNHLMMEKERLEFQIRQLSSLDRIQSRAESELGLTVVREAPVWINVDRSKIRELEESASGRTQ